MFQSSIELLLKRKIGISTQAIGAKTLTRAIRMRMADCGMSDGEVYLAYLQTAEEEWEKLIEWLVVPETWFFRNKESFIFVKQYIKSEWLAVAKNEILRVLSIPCSTGEEPYSIAMTLIEAGLSNNRFYLEAVDISERALQQAKRGIYTQKSFRGQDEMAFQKRYFNKTPQGYQIHAAIKRTVHFVKGNLLDESFWINKPPYDIIFCRNLLIYWDKLAKWQGLKHLYQLLNNNGLIFWGHAEKTAVCGYGFEQIRQSGVFACRKRDNSFNSKTTTISPNYRCNEAMAITHQPNSPERRNNPHPTIQLSVLPNTPDSILENTTSKPDAKLSQHSSDQEMPLSPAVPANPKLDKGTKWFDMAQKMADQGNLIEALHLCQHCLQKQADHIQAHFLMGIIYQALDLNNQAEEQFNKTIYLNPNHSEALNYLACLVERRGDRTQATHLRRRIQRIRQRELSFEKSS